MSKIVTTKGIFTIWKYWTVDLIEDIDYWIIVIGKKKTVSIPYYKIKRIYV